MSSKGGKGEGRDSLGEQGPGGDDEDKIIRLPRDWLGPRDELVPFGPSAERGSEEPRESGRPFGERDEPGHDASARPPLEEVSSSSSDPVSPDDFWGERSAALQGPLEEADREAALADESGPTRRRRRARVVGAAAAALVGVTVVTLSLLGQSSNLGKSRVSAGVDTGGGRGTLWPLPAHTPPAFHRASRSAHGQPKPKRPSAGNGGASVAVNYVRQTSSPQGAAGAGSGTGSGSTAPSSLSHVSVTGPTPSSGTSGTTPTRSTSPTGGTSSTRSQPKAPAFGANGALAPGHSRTG